MGSQISYQHYHAYPDQWKPTQPPAFGEFVSQNSLLSLTMSLLKYCISIIDLNLNVLKIFHHVLRLNQTYEKNLITSEIRTHVHPDQ